jgi:hypothetical protein
MPAAARHLPAHQHSSHTACLLPRAAQGEPLAHLVRGAGAVLLQREVPEHVNMAVATAAAAAGVPVLLVSCTQCERPQSPQQHRHARMRPRRT